MLPSFCLPLTPLGVVCLLLSTFRPLLSDYPRKISSLDLYRARVRHVRDRLLRAIWPSYLGPPHPSRRLLCPRLHLLFRRILSVRMGSLLLDHCIWDPNCKAQGYERGSRSRYSIAFQLRCCSGCAAHVGATFYCEGNALWKRLTESQAWGWSYGKSWVRNLLFLRCLLLLDVLLRLVPHPRNQGNESWEDGWYVCRLASFPDFFFSKLWRRK